VLARTRINLLAAPLPIGATIALELSGPTPGRSSRFDNCHHSALSFRSHRLPFRSSHRAAQDDNAKPRFLLDLLAFCSIRLDVGVRATPLAESVWFTGHLFRQICCDETMPGRRTAISSMIIAALSLRYAVEAQRRDFEYRELSIQPRVILGGDADAFALSIENVGVADSGVVSQYAGTIFQFSYNGFSSADGTITQMGNTSTASLNGNSTGTMMGSATPTYRYSRRTDFSARLVHSKSARNLWVGSGEVNAGGGKGHIGRLIVADSLSSSRSISAIFDDLQNKGLIGAGGASYASPPFGPNHSSRVFAQISVMRKE
jgi:hypothetical protein